MAPSKADPRDDSVQVVDDVIDASLIDNAVSSVGAASATESTYTEMDWTPACEELLRTYREKIHPSVIDRPQISDFVKPPTETESTFKVVARINPSVRGTPIRGIGLPTDYHIVIPLVPQGLPRWAEVRSTKTRQEVPWKKGSVVYIKGGTDLICSEEGGGIYILIGGKTRKHP